MIIETRQRRLISRKAFSVSPAWTSSLKLFVVVLSMLLIAEGLMGVGRKSR
jgi:hypothetical protein